MKDFPLIFSAPMVQANRKGIKRMTRRVLVLDRLKVVMRREVRSDLPAFIRPPLVAPKAAKLPATLNPHGAVSCLINGRELGLKPREFDFVCPYAQGKTILATEGGKSTWTIIPHESRVWVREKFNFSRLDELAPGETFGKTIDQCIDDNKGFRPSCCHGVVYAADGVTEHPKHGKALWRPSIHMPRWACRDVYTVIKVRLELLQDITEADAIAEGVEPVDRDPEGDILYRDYFEDGYAWSAKASFISLWHSLNGFKGPNAWNCNPWVWVVEYDNPLWKGVQ